MEKDKQILEIADILLEVSRQDSNGVNNRADFAEFDADTIFKYGCDRLNGAAALCRAGYRKQFDGEWIVDEHEWDFPPYFYYDYKCSVCGNREQNRSPYCRECGSKMKGE